MMHWSDSSGASAEGVTVTVPTHAALMADLDARLQARRGFTIATLNLDHVTKLRKDRAFRDAYLAHSHVTADGNPIVWFSRMAGQQVDLLPGSELIEPVSKLAARHGVPVALFGSTKDSLDAAAAGLVARFPTLEIAAAISPPMGFDPTGAQADEAIAALGASGAGVCFLALGAPKQEIFAAHAAHRLPHMGFMSIGAGLDFISGRQVRAPLIVRRLALEWLWRLALSPARLARRYGACIALLPGLFLTARKSRMRAQREAAR